MKRLIVIDDDETVLQLMQDVLALEGYFVQIGSNEQDLQRLVREPTDLIILDVFLKGEDGREVCHHLKQSERTRHIPVILYSAHIRVQEALPESSADAFLEKPFHLPDLLTLVAQHISPIAL